MIEKFRVGNNQTGGAGRFSKAGIQAEKKVPNNVIL